MTYFSTRAGVANFTGDQDGLDLWHSLYKATMPPSLKEELKRQAEREERAQVEAILEQYQRTGESIIGFSG